MSSFYVYWITSGKSSYIGATVDPCKRLRQHNREIKGGANRTRGKLWSFQCVIQGFRTWKEALMFEWAAKFYSKKCRSVKTRKEAILNLMQKERWTSNSPPACEVELFCEWEPIKYGLPPETLPICSTKPVKMMAEKKRGFPNLHGVNY
jgi:predicted GIY-YIG superfamily endonuclease